MKNRLTSAFFLAIALLFGLSNDSHGQANASRGQTNCKPRSAEDTLIVVLKDSAEARQWDASVLERLKRHEVCVGMTSDMMKKAWGLSPNLMATVPRNPGDTTVQYYYRGATVVVVNSRVRAIRPPRQSPR